MLWRRASWTDFSKVLFRKGSPAQDQGKAVEGVIFENHQHLQVFGDRVAQILGFISNEDSYCWKHQYKAPWMTGVISAKQKCAIFSGSGLAFMKEPPFQRDNS